jgi:hypothetical protein
MGLMMIYAVAVIETRPAPIRSCLYPVPPIRRADRLKGPRIGAGLRDPQYLRKPAPILAEFGA